MERLGVQEKRLGGIREALRSRFAVDASGDRANAVDVLDRLVGLQTRSGTLQRKVQELAKLKQELVDELYSQDCRLPTAAEVDKQDMEGNLVCDHLEALVLSGEALEAHRGALAAQGQVNKLLAASEGRRDFFVAPATETAIFENVLTSRADLQVALNAAKAYDSSSKENDADAAQRDERERDGDRKSEPRKPDERMVEFEVDAFAFGALPDSVRGRAKLAEVQRTLAILVDHNRKKRKSKRRGANAPISVKDLDALGAKVVGHTGASVLQCLRSLGFVEISKNTVALVQR